MRRAIPLLLMSTAALAREPPIPSADDEWVDALNAAHAELQACSKLGDSLHLYGDVTVTYNRNSKTWTRTASKSLDAVGEKAAACVQDALARHYRDDSYATSFDPVLDHVQTIGTPKIMLPPIEKLLPAWRAHDRKALAKLLPRDYAVTFEGCLKTLTCDGKPRTGTLRVAITKYQWYEGTHLEKLPPGAHTLVATNDFGKPGERRGIATITVTYAGGAPRATVAATPVGTGKTIRGTTQASASIHSRCTDVYRSTTADGKGHFQLDDVGPPPCSVDASGHDSMGTVNVKTLSADVKIELRSIREDYEP